MKARRDKSGVPNPGLGTPGSISDLYLEIGGHQKSCRLPVQVKNLADEGVILKVSDFPAELDGETLLQQEAVIHLVPDGVTKETQLQSRVVWVRHVEDGPGHYLLGLDLGAADLRTRRVLGNFMARPNDMSDLWTYWDQAQPKPVRQTTHDGKFIFFVGAGVSLAGLGLKVALHNSYDVMAMTLMLLGIYIIAGKCLWNWWRGRSIPKEG